MSELLVFCTRCGKESERRQVSAKGLCGFCGLDDAIKPLLSQYARLWARHLGYERLPEAKRGPRRRQCEQQMTRLATRVGDKIHARIARPELAIALINGHLAGARQQAERGSGRIVLATA